MTRPPELIDHQETLVETCERLKDCAWLAVDTEFERVSTYYPELCVVQLTGGGEVAVVDFLAMPDPAPLYTLLYEPAITKVFHAARQDFELFYFLRGELPAPLFDTQVAAALLGYDQQIGYANLVREVLGVELPKTQARTDWKRRPLKEKQLRYAADDVIYLGRLYEVLRDKLAEADLLAQLEERCQALYRPELYEPDPGQMWKKIKIREVQRFDEPTLAVFRELAAWRERTARAENRPRKWVIKDHALVNIARERPADRQSLAGLDGMTDKIMRQYGEALLKIATPGADPTSTG